MALATLFNLDPAQFALGRSTGRFRGITENKTAQNYEELGSLLKSIQTVTAEKPGEFTAVAPARPELGTAPTAPVLPTAPVQPNISAAPTAPTLADPVSTYKNYLNAGNVDKKINDQMSASDEWVQGYITSDRALQLILSGQTSDPLNTGFTKPVAARSLQEISRAYNEAVQAEAAKATEYNTTYANWKATQEPLINKYNTDVTAYKATNEPIINKYIADINAFNTQAKQKTDVYNTEVTAYNKVLDTYKSKVNTYNTDVARYQKEVEDTRDKFQREYLSQNVDQAAIPAEGEVLAASSLYSDTLHQEMLSKIAEANQNEPAADRVTSLYATK